MNNIHFSNIIESNPEDYNYIQLIGYRNERWVCTSAIGESTIDLDCLELAKIMLISIRNVFDVDTGALCPHLVVPPHRFLIWYERGLLEFGAQSGGSSAANWPPQSFIIN